MIMFLNNTADQAVFILLPFNAIDKGPDFINPTSWST